MKNKPPCIPQMVVARTYHCVEMSPAYPLFYLFRTAVFRCFLKTIATNNIPTIKGRTNNNENSGIEGEGVGDEVGPELGVVTEIGIIIGLLSWLYASMM
jgi:hypothetical protein